MDPFLYSLNQIPVASVTSVGLKAFHLSQLLQKEYPVLPGFVVTAEALGSVLQSISWQHPLFADFPGSALWLDINNPLQLQAIATQFRYAITTASLPDALTQDLARQLLNLPARGLILRPSLVVDRSSTSIFAAPADVSGVSGDLFNPQICPAELPSFIHALQTIWADLFSAKSLFYWQHLGIPLQHVRLGVLVQSIQDGVAAGTVITTPTQFQIQATPGLGLTINWGEVVPDTYVVAAQSGQVQEQHLGWKAIAYQLTDPLTASTPALIASPLSETQQQQYTLDSTDLAQLVHLVKRVVAEVGSDLSLGWTLHQSENSPRQLHLTHVLPIVGHTGTLSKPQKTRTSRLWLSSQGRVFPTQRTTSQQIYVGSGLAASGGQVFARASVLTSTQLPDDIPPHTVLVAPTIPLDWLPWIETAAALVTEQGSMTSHCAILARELRVPAVLSVSNATQQIQPGELLWVDGDRGRVYRIAKPSETTHAHSPHPPSPSPFDAIHPSPYSSPPTSSPISAIGHPARHTQLMVNLSQPTNLAQVAALPVDGVGLVRSELLALSVLDVQSPQQWLQQHSSQEFVHRMAAAIRRFAEVFYPRPVFYRSLDLRPHEWYEPAGHPTHACSELSVLGLRGAFSYQLAPELFQAELAAIAQVQQAGFHNLRLVLPFVRAVEEFVVCRQWVEAAGLMQIPDFELWIMAEVPSVLLLLPDLVNAGVQGISIGTNDLTQLLLGVSRDQPELTNVFNERHPAVTRAIAQLIQQSQQLGIPCSICGEAPARDPDLVKNLVEWGIDAISVAPEAVERTRVVMIQAEHSGQFENQKLS